MPGQLNVAAMLWLRNLRLGWGMEEFAIARFNLLGNGGHWWSGSKAEVLDEVDEQELRLAVANSPYAREIPDMLREAVDLLAAEPV